MHKVEIYTSGEMYNVIVDDEHVASNDYYASIDDHVGAIANTLEMLGIDCTIRYEVFEG